LLAGERRFQNAFKNLLVAELQSLLDRRVRIKGGKAGVFIAAAGEIPQGSQVHQPGEKTGNPRKCRQREILNDSSVLL